MQCPDCGKLRHENDCDPKPNYEQLVWERDEASTAYMNEIKAAPPVRERTKEQQAAIDRVLHIYHKKQLEVWHFGVFDAKI